MRKKKTVNDEINEFLEYWGSEGVVMFMEDVVPLLNMYSQDTDYLSEEQCDNERNVRLVRTVYLLSIIAENHATKINYVNSKFMGLSKRIENQGKEE